MTPRPCTDGTLRHLSVDLTDDLREDGGDRGYTLCSAPERPVWGEDQWAITLAYEMHRTDTYIDIAALPPCAECLRVAESLADPATAASLHRRPPRPEFASGFPGDAVRGFLRMDVATGTSAGLRAAVHLLNFTAIPDQPGFGDLVRLHDLVWDLGDVVRIGQVTDWTAVLGFAASADVPERDRRLIALAASLGGGPPVALEAALELFDDPAAARQVIEAVAIASGHGDRWELTEKPAPNPPDTR